MKMQSICRCNLKHVYNRRKNICLWSLFSRCLLTFVFFIIFAFTIINFTPYQCSQRLVSWKHFMRENVDMKSDETHFYLFGSWGNIVEAPPGCTVHPLFDAFAVSCLNGHFAHQVTLVIEVMEELVVHFAVCETCSTQVPQPVRKLPSNSQVISKKKTQRIEVTLPPLHLSCRIRPEVKNAFFQIPSFELDAQRCLIRFDFLASLPDLTPSTPPICFATVGDWGSPSKDQAEVIKQLQRLMERNWVKYIVFTGDNFYPRGVSSADHPAWKRTFEDPFSDEVFRNVMFLVSLGNHDLGNDVKHQVEYGKKHPRWFLPDSYYGISIPLLGKVSGSKKEWMSFDVLDIFVLNSYHVSSWKQQLKRGSKFFSSRKTGGNHRWRLVVNHESVFSGSLHGSNKARNLPFRKRILPFISDHKINMYLNGDDHILELHHLNGTDFVTSGAGGGSVRYQSEVRMPTTVWRPERVPGSSGPGNVEVLGLTLHCTVPFSNNMVTTLYDVSTGEEKVLYVHETFYRR